MDPKAGQRAQRLACGRVGRQTHTQRPFYAKGRDAIHAYLAESFAGQYKGTQVTGRPLDLRLLSADSGILLTEGGVLPAGHTEVPDEQSIRASWVVVRRDGEWRLPAYQNSHARLQLPAPGGVA
ncbi:SgcJ/EcaC family oxidoreductase [Streptomyces sp. NPDC004609]|uniref:SgcJ/EcaC family oxidoreductase n=1 Tax=Streptomyces sp. NPDC004609 TaxID=3364704 RepID=UPI0036C143AA